MKQVLGAENVPRSRLLSSNPGRSRGIQSPMEGTTDALLPFTLRLNRG